jgi:hypothetical protein
MNTTHKPNWWYLWCVWVAASVAGFGLPAIGFQGLGLCLTQATPAVLGALIFCGTAGVGASLPGFLHYFILRDWFPRAAWWILASGAGSISGFILLGWGLAVADTGTGIVHEYVLPNLAFGGAGAVVGTMQWLVFRRWFSRAGWWVAASTMSWLGATYVYALSTRGNDVNVPLGGILSGAVSGAITGLVLILLWRNTPANQTPAK